ncbi:MAG: arsenate reductase (glutaredoxin) [Saprospiraceae bacterium]
MILYHNPRCGKSREAFKILIEKGESPKIREYLKEVPTADEIEELLTILGIDAVDLVRTSEQIYKDEYKHKKMSKVAWIEAMIEHPKLIQRPILIANGKAIIGRPPERILDIL